ncbi:hypothetical protein J5N97_000181 [Dioscorea zingiberensis]|uniref:Uncharacterized protein n=1 Tax=Dioscorea zingiberensis TaxID=325984 RepID=A0A9D5BSU7_9LILI|nr:hypothetical protein J5N97_000181 [Dioscorea zingiberensis]
MVNEMELKENEHPYRWEDRKLWKKLPHVPGMMAGRMPRKAIKTKKESDDKFWDWASAVLFGLWGFRQRPYLPGAPSTLPRRLGIKSSRSDIMTSDYGAAATAFLHKLQKGIPPWKPLKGFEWKTYKQLQDEAIESKKRDMAVLAANDGIWPGVRTSSHALFLWASGSELTSILEKDLMPNKYISKELRSELSIIPFAKIIPGLRPWEVLSIEQAMDQITFEGSGSVEPLGSYTTGPLTLDVWNKDVKRMFRIFSNLSYRVYNKLERTIPGFNVVMQKVRG